MGSRAATAVVGVLASLPISAAAWYYFETFLLFLFVPFVPLLLRRRAGGEPTTASAAPGCRECPHCGIRSADPTFEYCPRGGTRLERTGVSGAGG